MKTTVENSLTALAELESLGERTSKDGSVLPPVKIPAEKQKTNYWIGRLAAKLKPIRKAYQDAVDAYIKENGEPQTINKEVDGRVEKVAVEGGMVLPVEKNKAFDIAHREILAQEEEVDIKPLDFELFDGIELPASFFQNLGEFINEPKN